MNRKPLYHSLYRQALLYALATALALVALPGVAAADHYILYGQVFEVPPQVAADESIADANLPVSRSMPFVRLRAVDAVSGVDRGAVVYAGATGNFTLSLDAPAGSSVAIQVSRIVNDEAVRIPEARPGINTVTLTGHAAGVAVKVASDEVLLLGAGSGLHAQSVGIVFTQVGLVEIPYISQEPQYPPGLLSADQMKRVQARVGLADLSRSPEDLKRAAELNLPANPSAANQYAVFKDAPFGGRLHLFGAFGSLSGVSPCTGKVDWYQVKIAPFGFMPGGVPTLGPAVTGSDPLAKMRFEIDYVPTFKARAFLEKLGPYDGRDWTSGPGVSISNLYRVHAAPTTPTQTVVYSMADMRYDWVTEGLSGLYEVSLEYYRQVPGGTATAPWVVKIPSGCFNGTLSPEEAAKVALHKLRVRIDNTPLTFGIEGIYLRTGNTRSGNFLAPGHKCDIIEIGSGSQVEVDFQARQDHGYLRYYRLWAQANDGTMVPFKEESYDQHSATGPLWAGVGTASGPETAQPAPGAPAFTKCAYSFNLWVYSRLQNGYGYIEHRYPQQVFYVKP